MEIDIEIHIARITQMLDLMEKKSIHEEQRYLLNELKKQGNVTLEILNALLKWGETQLKA